MHYPTILSLPDGTDLVVEQTPTTIEIRLSLVKLGNEDRQQLGVKCPDWDRSDASDARTHQ